MSRWLFFDGGFVTTDCSNAFNTVNRTTVLREVANCVLALPPLATKCMARDQRMCFLDGLRGDQDDRLLQRTPTGGPVGSVMFCLAMRSGLKRFGEEFEGGVRAFAYTDGASLDLMGVTSQHY